MTIDMDLEEGDYEVFFEVRMTIDMDLEEGDYEVFFENKSHPGQDLELDWALVQRFLQVIIKQLDTKIDTKGEA